MALGPRPSLKLAPRVALTPALRQSIALLAMGGRDLAFYIEQELRDNPWLDRDREDRAWRPQPAPLILAEAGAGRSGKAGASFSTLPKAATGADSIAAIPEGEIGLIEHLSRQIAIDIKRPGDRKIAEAMLEDLDSAGYFTGDIESVARQWKKPVAAIAAILEQLQRLEPAGIFARNLAECLRLQLADRGELDPPMRAILDRLDLVARQDWRRLAKLAQLSEAELARHIARIKRLDPKPGASFARAIVPTVLPDILVRMEPEGAITVALNPLLHPRLTLQREIGPSGNRPIAAPFAEARQRARWLLKTLEHRSRSLIALGEAIFTRQSAFCRDGARALKPLTRGEVAKALGLHESSIGRLVAGKFAETPQGLFPLRFFFGPGLGSEGDARAGAAIRARLRALIAGEAKGAPLSDAELRRRLQAEGVVLARRTIAKYREMLKIPESRQRRRRKGLPLAGKGLNHR